MCDFSLEAVSSRPAKVGDKLTTQTFNTGTRGFAHPKIKGWPFASLQALSCLLRRKSDSGVWGPGPLTWLPAIGLPSLDK
jgi:hypothetical protein